SRILEPLVVRFPTMAPSGSMTMASRSHRRLTETIVMSSVARTAATLDDLYRISGKAELIAGRIVPLMPTGFRSGQIGGRIYRSLDDYAARTSRGAALPDNVGFAVPELLSGRQSFAPDAAYYLGPLPADD